MLAELTRGGRDAVDQLMPLLYDELRHVAHRQLRNQRGDHTLDTAALVNEACLFRPIGRTEELLSDLKSGPQESTLPLGNRRGIFWRSVPDDSVVVAAPPQAQAGFSLTFCSTR